jgi:hypothetical protein
VQDERGDAVRLEGVGELMEVFEAVGQRPAAPAAPGGVGDVCRDPLVAVGGVTEWRTGRASVRAFAVRIAASART